MDFNSYQRTYPNLSKKELERLHLFLTNFPNQTIDWLKIIDKSDDLDPLRAKAIDLARIKSAIRYSLTNRIPTGKVIGKGKTRHLAIKYKILTKNYKTYNVIEL